MILKSLIEDESRLTLDCAKATVVKGAAIEIPDKYYYHPEVQGALKAGIVELDGDPPKLPPELVPPTMAKQVFVNTTQTRLTFDSIKASVGIDEAIEIPVDALDNHDIAEALGLRWLTRENEATTATEEEDPALTPEEPQTQTYSDPALFEEVVVEEPKAEDLTPETKPEPEEPQKKESQEKARATKETPEKQDKPQPVKAAKAKAVTRSGSDDKDDIIDTSPAEEDVLDTSASQSDEDEMFKETPTFESLPKKKAKKSSKKTQNKAKKSKPKAEPKPAEPAKDKDEDATAEKSKEEEGYTFFNIFD